MRTQLLCTFCNKNDYEECLLKINNVYDIIFDRIYVLENSDNPFYLYLTYNVEYINRDEFLPKTISVHRKKHSNTLYTINALNELVKRENNGNIDDSFELDWDNYFNSIILTSDEGVKIVNTNLYKIVNL